MNRHTLALCALALFALSLNPPPAAACGPGSWSGSVCNNRWKSKVLTSVCFEIEGSANTVVSGVTDELGAAIAGATVTRQSQGKYEVCFPLALDRGKCFKFCVDGTALNGSGIVTTKKTYAPADPPTASYSVITSAPGFPYFQATIDVYAMGGTPGGQTHLGVFIPAGMFAYFVQVNNSPASIAPLLSVELSQSQADVPPALIGDLGLPHDGTRSCCGTPAFPVIPVATFDMFGFAPATPTSSINYDPSGENLILTFGPGIPPGGSSNVIAYMSPAPPSIQSDVNLSPRVRVMAAGPLALGRAVGPKARYGDLDRDVDTDLADFEKFVRCFTGPGAYAAVGCDLADLDGDGDVDLDDAARFNNNLTGPLP